MVEAYHGLREDLVRTTYASYLVELLDRFTADEDKHRGEYDLLANSLGWLEKTADILLVARYYELRLLGLAGYQPRLFRCVSCGEPIEEQDQFLVRKWVGFYVLTARRPIAALNHSLQ
jgi:DNA repair protein RecO (recombination protein O)